MICWIKVATFMEAASMAFIASSAASCWASFIFSKVSVRSLRSFADSVEFFCLAAEELWRSSTAFWKSLAFLSAAFSTALLIKLVDRLARRSILFSSFIHMFAILF
eukprot:UN00571